MTVLRGSTRTVFLLGPVAIKVPSWSRFSEGLERNLRESQFVNHRDCPCPSVLCPVLSVGGFLNIMPRTRPLTPEEWYSVQRRLPTFLRQMTGEKQESFGKLPSGRTVAVDYGTPLTP